MHTHRACCLPRCGHHCQAQTAPTRTPCRILRPNVCPARPRASPKAVWSPTHHPHLPPTSRARRAAISGPDRGRQAPPSIGVRGQYKTPDTLIGGSQRIRPRPPITPRGTHGPDSLGKASRARPPWGPIVAPAVPCATGASFISYPARTAPAHPVYTRAPSSGKSHFLLPLQSSSLCLCLRLLLRLRLHSQTSPDSAPTPSPTSNTVSTSQTSQLTGIPPRVASAD